MLRCPRCNRFSDTVLLDQDGEPYICDDCWDEIGGYGECDCEVIKNSLIHDCELNETN